MEHATIGRRDLLLTLIGTSEDGSITGVVNGITRLQKLLFLLEQEAGLKPTGNGFKFEAYKAGPYSKNLYDDLELLENLDLVTSDPTAEATALESADIKALSFEDLIVEDDVGPQNAIGMRPDSYEERKFGLTEKGRQRVEALMSQQELSPIVEEIRKMKGRFSHYSLTDLLRYVYTKYPAMATESEIIDKVMGKAKR
jgi:hypothetical protein